MEWRRKKGKSDRFRQLPSVKFPGQGTPSVPPHHPRRLDGVSADGQSATASDHQTAARSRQWTKLELSAPRAPVTWGVYGVQRRRRLPVRAVPAGRLGRARPPPEGNSTACQDLQRGRAPSVSPPVALPGAEEEKNIRGEKAVPGAARIAMDMHRTRRRRAARSGRPSPFGLGPGAAQTNGPQEIGCWTAATGSRPRREDGPPGHGSPRAAPSRHRQAGEGASHRAWPCVLSARPPAPVLHPGLMPWSVRTFELPPYQYPPLPFRYLQPGRRPGLAGDRRPSTGDLRGPGRRPAGGLLCSCASLAGRSRSAASLELASPIWGSPELGAQGCVGEARGLRAAQTPSVPRHLPQPSAGSCAGGEVLVLEASGTGG